MLEVTVWGIRGSVPKKKRKAAVGMICRKGRFIAENESFKLGVKERRGDG